MSDATIQPPRRTFRQRVLRSAWRIGRVLLLAYLGLGVVLYVMQTKLMFPGAASRGTPEAQLSPPPGTELVPLPTAGGQKIVALFGRAQGPDRRELRDYAQRPTLLFFYGNGMCLRDAVLDFQEFRRLGINVLIPEYVGYPMSTGEPSEQGCYDTANACWQYLRGRKDIAGAKIVVGGWSLGAAVAIDLAAREPAAGLVAYSAFTSAVDMGQRFYPLLPVGLLMKHRFESQRKIPAVRCPILLGHGRRDSLIPAYMSERLAESAQAPVTRFVVDSDHNDFMDISSEVAREKLTEFLRPLMP